MNHPTCLQSKLGQHVALMQTCYESPIWQYQYNTLPKPCIHPLCTPAGHSLTLFEPHDHVWQRGLWFAIKFVNDDNFWEEREPFGRQETVGAVNLQQDLDGKVHLTTKLKWRRPEDGTTLITEQRRMIYTPFVMDAYTLDFEFTLRAVCNLTLERTPFTTWGGYGGLAFRGTRNWEETRLIFADGSTSERPTGQRAPWCDLAGKLDGGPNRTGGLAIFDHPDNPRYPTPWYGNNQPGYYFVNAAFLFEKPMQLPEGDTLTLRYRVLVHDGVWEQGQLQDAYDAYLKS